MSHRFVCEEEEWTSSPASLGAGDLPQLYSGYSSLAWRGFKIIRDCKNADCNTEVTLNDKWPVMLGCSDDCLFIYKLRNVGWRSLNSSRTTIRSSSSQSHDQMWCFQLAAPDETSSNVFFYIRSELRSSFHSLNVSDRCCVSCFSQFVCMCCVGVYTEVLPCVQGRVWVWAPSGLPGDMFLNWPSFISRCLNLDHVCLYCHRPSNMRLMPRKRPTERHLQICVVWLNVDTMKWTRC